LRTDQRNQWKCEFSNWDRWVKES